jgi:glucokinase
MFDLAIDIGGTKTLIAVFKENESQPFATEKISTLSDAGFESFVERIVKVSTRLTGGSPIRRWGVCTAGAVNTARGLLLWSPNLGWKNVDLYGVLSQEFGPAGFIENDCNAAAYGEWYVRPGTDLLGYVTVSTGIGMGIVSEGRILHGSHCAAGEIGHTIVRPGGPQCTCGRRGCLQAIAGGRGLERVTQEKLGISLATEEIVNLSLIGDLRFKEIVSDAADTLGRFVANICDIIDPEILVIGGSLGRNDHYFRLVFESAMQAYYPLPGRDLKIELSSVTPSSNILGTLILARQYGGVLGGSESN